MKKLSSKTYKQEFVNQFEGDDSRKTTPRQTPGMLYSKAFPSPVKAPELLAWSKQLAKELQIQSPDQEDIQILAGNLITPSMYPYAACYAGHQFGNWAGQLGDGRAITLGEWVTAEGKSWELQLKGAGLTAYSRNADGRAVLRSSVREYLMSEAMYYLGVPTTRALSLVATGEKVMRDMFYDGNPEYEPGAIVLRIAPSFLRFGNFEILAARKELDNLRKLVDWTIEKHYPHIQGENKIATWYKEVVERTAALMVEWLRVGFVHGVMNTDNMSILGLTIDYGPYSFVDNFDPNFTPNTTDLPGRRYAFGKQAPIAKWNLACLGGALAPLFTNTEALREVLETYDEVYWNKYYEMMAGKLGLDQLTEADAPLISAWQKMLSTLQPDMTIFYQQLIELNVEEQNKQTILHHFSESFYKALTEPEAEMFYDLIKQCLQRIKNNTCSREEALQRMRTSNPRFILRNYLLHQAIEELENGKDELFVKLQQALKEPYSNQFDAFFTKRPDWATQKAGCSMLSCSS